VQDWILIEGESGVRSQFAYVLVFPDSSLNSASPFIKDAAALENDSGIDSENLAA
jgi:hypothetical protein